MPLAYALLGAIFGALVTAVVAWRLRLRVTTHRFRTLPAPPKPAVTVPPVSLHGVRVLIVDDHSRNRHALNDLLASWGMKPTMSASGIEALLEVRAAAERQAPYGLVLSDMSVSGMDGFELARQIDLDAALQGTPVIVLSAIAELFQAELPPGVQACLRKPIKPADLRKAFLGQTAAREDSNKESCARALAAGRVFDRQLAVSYLAGDEALLVDLASRFRVGAPELLERMRIALASGQWEDVARAAHALRGSSSQLGAAEAAEAALCLENAAKGGRRADVETAFSRVANAVAVLVSALPRADGSVNAA